MGRAILEPSVRLLNHNELIYAPGDRGLARDLFRALGCRVLDPQEETGPGDLGPAAGPYLIIFVQPDSDDLIDNVMYASEATPAQWAFERLLRNHIDGDEELTEARKAFLAQFSVTPYAMTHFGIAMNEAQQEAALERIAANPELRKRVRVAGPFRPGDPGSVDPRVIQAFIRTDIVSANLLAGEQQIELQVRLD
jgi:hypothetical protein